MFHDRARIRVRGGRGGDGALSFRREKFVPKGGPDGGDGGDGGDVVLVADSDLRDLSFFARGGAFKAGRGRHGEGSNRHGADGEDVELHVPVGTQVFDSEGGLLVDLAHPGARATVAHGGHGGAGNRRFASPIHQAPRVAELGAPGEEGELELRLKLLADAAFLGFPNAGKSSLLRRISNAKPKVADYPFTTLAPVLGTVDARDGRQLTVADVPGLLEGASEGVGLGDEFLAHLERAGLFLHVIEADVDAETRFHAIDRELAAYGAGLLGAAADRGSQQGRPRGRAAGIRGRRRSGAGDRAHLGRHRQGNRRLVQRLFEVVRGRGGSDHPAARGDGRLSRLPAPAAATARRPHLPHRRRLSRARRGFRRGSACGGGTP